MKSRQEMAKQSEGNERSLFGFRFGKRDTLGLSVIILIMCLGNLTEIWDAGLLENPVIRAADIISVALIPICLSTICSSFRGLRQEGAGKKSEHGSSGRASASLIILYSFLLLLDLTLIVFPEASGIEANANESLLTFILGIIPIPLYVLEAARISLASRRIGRTEKGVD